MSKIKSFIPILGAFALTIFVSYLQNNHVFPDIENMKGFDSLVGSIFTFATVIIGFYTTMLGIIISVSKNSIMQKIKDSSVATEELNWKLGVSIFMAFLVVFTSGAMQLHTNIPRGFWGNIITDIWIFSVLSFFLSSILTTILMFRIIAAPESEEEKLDS